MSGGINYDTQDLTEALAALAQKGARPMTTGERDAWRLVGEANESLVAAEAGVADINRRAVAEIARRAVDAPADAERAQIEKAVGDATWRTLESVALPRLRAAVDAFKAAKGAAEAASAEARSAWIAER